MAWIWDPKHYLVRRFKCTFNLASRHFFFVRNQTHTQYASLASSGDAMKGYVRPFRTVKHSNLLKTHWTNYNYFAASNIHALWQMTLGQLQLLIVIKTVPLFEVKTYALDSVLFRVTCLVLVQLYNRVKRYWLEMQDALEFIWKTMLSFGESQVQEIETFLEKIATCLMERLLQPRKGSVATCFATWGEV